MATSLSERVQQRLEATGKSARAASVETGLSTGFIRNILLGKSVSPRADNLEKLAAALRTSSGWLLRGDGPEEIGAPASADRPEPPRPTPNASFPPIYQEFSGERIPLLGQVAGGPNGRFILNGEQIGRVFAPPQLVGVKGAYAVYVYGDSMEPRYFAGEVVWLHPYTPVRQGDFVVAQVGGDVEADGLEGYVKQFVSRTGSGLTLRQLNPPEGEEELLRFPEQRVFSVHKIVFSGSL